MVFTLQELPNELLDGIFAHLPRADLKSARHICLRWSDVGAKYLFHRVYIAPRKGPMAILLKVASHPVFCKSIKEVVYDGRLFEKDLLDEVKYRDRLREGHEDWVGELGEGVVDTIAKGYESSYRSFKTLYNEQQAILHSFVEQHVLHDILARLPNVVKVVITDTFIDDLPTRPCDHYCFNDALSKELGRSFAPIGWTYFRVRGIDSVRMEERETPLDCRGIPCLIHAMSLHTPRIAELQLGTHTFANGNALPLLEPTVILDHIQNVVSRLRSLKLDCQFNQSGSAQVRDRVTDLAAVMAKSTSLEVLACSDSTAIRHLWRMSHEPIWPCLKILHVGDITILPCDLMALFKAANQTLREVKLRNIKFLGPDSWEAIGDSIGNCLRVPDLGLNGVSCQVEDTPSHLAILNYVQVRDFARKIMRWVPPGDLKEDIFGDDEFTFIDMRVVKGPSCYKCVESKEQSVYLADGIAKESLPSYSMFQGTGTAFHPCPVKFLDDTSRGE